MILFLQELNQPAPQFVIVSIPQNGIANTWLSKGTVRMSPMWARGPVFFAQKTDKKRVVPIFKR